MLTFASARKRAKILVAALVAALGFSLINAAPAHAASWEDYGFTADGFISIPSSEASYYIITPRCYSRATLVDNNNQTTYVNLTTGESVWPSLGTSGCSTNWYPPRNWPGLKSATWWTDSGDIPAQIVRPSTVTNVHVTPGNKQINLTWDVADTPGSVDKFMITYWLGDSRFSGGAYMRNAVAAGNARSITLKTDFNSEYFNVEIVPWMLFGTGNATVIPASANIVPKAPARVQVVPGDKSLRVVYSAATPDEATIAKYDIVVEPTGQRLTVDSSVRELTLTQGISNNVTYQVSVAARNSAGTSPATDSNAATPRQTPRLVTNVKAVANGLTGARVSWTGATGDVTGYRVTNSNTGTSQVVPATTRSTVIPNVLVNGTRPTNNQFTVQTMNDYMISDPVSTSSAFIPNAPTAVSTSGILHGINAQWSAPADIENPIDYFLVDVLGANNALVSSVRTTDTEATFAGLSSASGYRVRVFTVTAWGKSSASELSNLANVQDVPAAPSYATARQDEIDPSSLIVSLGRVDTHGCALTGWTATASWSANGQIVSVTNSGLTNATTLKLSGVPADEDIAISITAGNCWGNSAASELSVHTYALPSAISNLQLSVNDAGNLVAQWTPAAQTSGVTTVLTLLPGNNTVKVNATTHRVIFKTVELGATYQVVVVNRNAFGQSPSVTSDPIKVQTLPGYVNSLQVNVDSAAGIATVSWLEPNYTGTDITGYTVWIDDQPAETTQDTSIIIEGLEPGATHTFSVYASNAMGDGPADSISFGLPQADVANPDDSGTVVVWELPAASSAIKSLTVQQKVGTKPWKNLATVSAKKKSYSMKKVVRNAKYRLTYKVKKSIKTITPKVITIN